MYARPTTETSQIRYILVVREISFFVCAILNEESANAFFFWGGSAINFLKVPEEQSWVGTNAVVRRQGVEEIRHCHKGFNTPSCDLETAMRPVFLLGAIRRHLIRSEFK